MEQPTGFKNARYPDHLYKLYKGYMDLSNPQEHSMNILEILLFSKY